MVCPHCGVENEQSSNFCSHCGRSLSSSAQTAYSIRVADLPDISRTRLLAALKTVPQETFVINESKLGWAAVGLTGSILGVIYVVSQANGYKWQSDDTSTNLLVVLVCFAIGYLSIAYLLRWLRSDFKATALLNPLYFLRFRFDRIEGVSLTSAGAWDAKHLSDSRGVYSGTRFYFRGGSKEFTLMVKSVQIANTLIVALKQFPILLSNLVETQDSHSLYALDLLYEWRHQEESFPRTSTKPAVGFRYLLTRLGPIVVAALVGVATFFLAIVPYNDACDDDLRWQTARTAATATAYRLYVASRPDGHHSTEAHTAIGVLYDKAADNYRTSTGVSGSQGIEAVISILEYAKATGHYKVVVRFMGDNQIPDNIDARLRSIYGTPRLVPVLPAFTDSINKTREARILQRISSSFGKIIPGDILQFAADQPNAHDPVFDVAYVIKASGSLYYPVSQEHQPEANRDWYTGISFNWNFNIVVPGTSTSRFQFSLDSQPAHLFNVAYQQATNGSAPFSPDEAYGAMADSAFDDFGSKLLSQLSVR
jgi:hypothetical protein